MVNAFTLTFNVLLALASLADAQWKVSTPNDERRGLPKEIPADARDIKPGDDWPKDNKFRWLMAELSIPETIGGKPAKGQAVGLQVNCGDGGEVYVNGQLQTRYDNDHPALVLISERARPGDKALVAVQVYGQVQGGDKFGEANWVLIDRHRVSDRLVFKVDPQKTRDPVPNGIAGLSQGGGLADYNDDTARKLREGGFRWFRMDNILTGVVKRADGGELTFDWADFDRRVDFIAEKMGADPILAVSYMPQVFDAVPNKDRQSAPRDYAQWEDLCFRAAKRCLDRGKRVPFWEVWNEVNSGWLKPGPQDTGTPQFKDIYKRALGEGEPDHETVRRFEAYCKLYQATARGVLRADPKAKIGGPALASGPFESKQYGHCANGKGFARGLMIWCQQEKLPLDFVSWHEYFQPSDVIRKEAVAFHEYLDEFPDLKKTVRSFMITEWNEAWWADRPQDHEIGAAWCADCIVRAFLPAGIDRPCFFYVKQGDMNFRGDYSLLMGNNVPKASYNVLKIFNNLSGRWVECTGGDDEVAVTAAWDEKQARLAIVLVNFNYRCALRRQVRVQVDELPQALAGGVWREWTVDATHSNIWNDPQHPDKADLTQTAKETLGTGGLTWDKTLQPDSVTLLELIRSEKAK
jgi:hypothetical protein